MQHFQVQLTNEEFTYLNSTYPESAGSGLIGKRATEIVKIYLRRSDPQCTILDGSAGADLYVRVSDGSSPQPIEIKGTASADIAWQQLKVSSTRSWELLTNESVPVYRVTAVFTKAPSIYILLHGRDFVLEPEPRWAFKRLSSGESSTKSTPSSPQPDTGAHLNATTRGESKYDSLREFLQNKSGDEVTLQFADAETVLGFPLPKSAFTHPAFWANQSDTTNRPWSRAWQEAGFEVEAYRLSEKNGWVRFKRKG